MNPGWPKGRTKDESCWSDKYYCRAPSNWCRLAKTEAEMQAIEFAKTTGLDVVTVSSTVVFGPFLQSTVNASSLYLMKLINGHETLEKEYRMIVDVRDVAEALLLVYERLEAEVRYICTGQMIKERDLADNKLRSLYPNYSYPKRFIDDEDGEMLSSEKLQKLGWRHRPLEETLLLDSIECYHKAGILY